MMLRALLVFSVLAGLALPASAQVTTLEQQLSIWDGLLKAAQANPGSVSLESFVPSYGNYCGLQATPAGATPFDCVDAACLAHDLSPAYSSAASTIEQVVQADRQFIATLSFVQAATPYGELYRTEAIQLFEAKTTYEQANRTTVFTRCTDCEPAQ